jgi:hypothetical protein
MHQETSRGPVNLWFAHRRRHAAQHAPRREHLSLKTFLLKSLAFASLSGLQQMPIAAQLSVDAMQQKRTKTVLRSVLCN